MARPAGKLEKNSEQAQATARRGIQSIEVGFRILDVIRKTGRPMPLKEIADACASPARTGPAAGRCSNCAWAR